jgi:hypothetical protein
VSRFITSLSKIKANSLNLAGTFGFTGTVSGLADETPLVLISTFTSDGSDATATFTSSHITSTYKEYMFVFNNIHPETNQKYLRFHPSIDNGSNYNLSLTSAMFTAYHREDGGGLTALEYASGFDTASGSTHYISADTGSNNDDGVSGIMRLYNPSSTTFVKHYHIQTVTSSGDGTQYAYNVLGSGYVNTTSAVNNVKFDFNSGEIQGGTIDLFGVV